MIATTFAFVFIKKHNYAQYTLALNGIKKEINSQERNEQLKSKKISNIIDIEIAYDKLLSIDNPFNSNGTILTFNSNGSMLTYQKYITEIYQRPFIQIKPEWAFLNIIKSVKAKITAQEAANANMTINDSNNSNNTRKRKRNNTRKRKRNNTNNITKGRNGGGMKTRNNRKLMKKHRTRKRKNKKRRTHKKR
jgi:hypothetical protein